MRILPLAATLLAATLLGAAGASAQQRDDSFRWSKAIAQGRTVELRGMNGAIRASAASGREVVVRAVKRWRRGNPKAVEVQVVEHAGGVTICAVWVERGGRCEPGEGSNGGKGRDGWSDRNDVAVDFELELPAGVAAEMSTVNGEIEAEGLASDIEASTVNGGVQVGTTGAAVASTVNGDVEVRMGRADWRGSQQFSTVNGSVEITLPAGADFDFRGSTVNGDIESDFPLTMTGRFSRKSLSGTVGKGGRSLSVTTVNGSIELRKG